MKIVIISIIIILIVIMAVAMILGFDNISVIRYDTYFQPVIQKEFITYPSFVLFRTNENLNRVPITASYDISQTLYFFEGYGIIVPNDMSLKEYFDSNTELITDFIPLSKSNVYVNSYKRYDDNLTAEILYSDISLIGNYRIKISRSEGGTYSAVLYSSSNTPGYLVPLDVMNIVQPFNSAIILNEYDKPILDNSEGGLNGIFKTLDYIFIDYPIYLYNYIDRYITFI